MSKCFGRLVASACKMNRAQKTDTSSIIYLHCLVSAQYPLSNLFQHLIVSIRNRIQHHHFSNDIVWPRNGKSQSQPRILWAIDIAAYTFVIAVGCARPTLRQWLGSLQGKPLQGPRVGEGDVGISVGATVVFTDSLIVVETPGFCTAGPFPEEVAFGGQLVSYCGGFVSLVTPIFSGSNRIISTFFVKNKNNVVICSSPWFVGWSSSRINHTCRLIWHSLCLPKTYQHNDTPYHQNLLMQPH